MNGTQPSACFLLGAMSALGHKRTYAVQNGMSALPPIADMRSALAYVRKVPIADIVCRPANALGIGRIARLAGGKFTH